MDREVQEYLETFPGLEKYFQAVLNLCKMTIEGFAGSGRNSVK